MALLDRTFLVSGKKETFYVRLKSYRICFRSDLHPFCSTSTSLQPNQLEQSNLSTSRAMKKKQKREIAVALAIIDHLKLLEFEKAARSLEKELKKRHDGVLPSTKRPVCLRWEETGRDAKESTKKITDKETSEGKQSISNSSKKGMPDRPIKKAKTSKEQRRKVEVVTPEETDNVSDTDVSDTDVSDVSSVEVSSSDSSGDERESDAASASSSEDEEEIKAAQDALAKAKARKAKEATEAALNWKPTPPSKATSSSQTSTVVKTAAGTDGAQALGAKGTPFKRVDSDYWGNEAVKAGGAAADNSYEGAFGSSGFGARSSEKLLSVRGKDFRHEKTKRKRSFNGIARTGGQIDTQKCFSTKFQYSDDEQ